jgi:uncharacterized protein YwbE
MPRFVKLLSTQVLEDKLSPSFPHCIYVTLQAGAGGRAAAAARRRHAQPGE